MSIEHYIVIVEEKSWMADKTKWAKEHIERANVIYLRRSERFYFYRMVNWEKAFPFYLGDDIFYVYYAKAKKMLTHMSPLHFFVFPPIYLGQYGRTRFIAFHAHSNEHYIHSHCFFYYNFNA